MHITRSADDPEFCMAAKAVLLRAEDMVSVDGQIDTYRLPLKIRPKLLTPEIKRLYYLFKEKKLPKIIHRRCSGQPGRRIRHARGPDILLFSKDTPPIGENQFIIVIGLKNPSQKNLAFSAVRRCHDNGDEIVAGNGTLPSWSENKLIREDFLNPTQKTGQGIVKEPPATNEEHRKHGRTIDNVTRTATEEPRKPLTPSQTFIEVLRQEAEVIVSILVRGNSEPIDFRESDILELDAPEIILPKTGYVLGMVIVYD